MVIYATWKSENIQLKLNPNGGDVEYNTKTVTYGVDYDLPIPTREHYHFDGWYYNDTQLCPLSGKWNFSHVDIELKARWSGTEVTVYFAKDDNVLLIEKSQVIAYGSSFVLPVPTILSGDKFIGWADEKNNLLTDSEGNSLSNSMLKNDTTLYAIYYTQVYTVGDLLKLCSFQPGVNELKRTYVLMNDLDFTGLSNASISNFEGVLDGNNKKIIGMSNSLFDTIGYNAESNITLKNIIFENYSGKAVVNKINASSNVLIDNIEISSFNKDQYDYCDFNGVVDTVDSGYSTSSLKINNCHINDEFTTLNSGFINYLYTFGNVNLSNCSIKSNTINSAFISGDRFAENYFENNVDGTKNTYIELSYCANYGDTTNLVRASAGSYYSINDKVGDLEIINRSTGIGTHNINISNIVNYGAVSESLFNNCYKIHGYYYEYLNYDYGKTESSCTCRTFTNSSFKIFNVLNFGSVNSFAKVISYTLTGSLQEAYWDLKHNIKLLEMNIYDVKNSFNCGLTANESLSLIDNKANIYFYTPFTNIDDGCLSITEKSFINKDFFINTIGLDQTRWDLNYIDITDKYGLPTIIF